MYKLEIKPAETLKTPWGTAKVSSNGYYMITSGKEGNNRKYLHRLIYEHFHDCKIPEGYVVHHVDGNKLNNCPVSNLELMTASEHRSLHNTGENHPNWKSYARVIKNGNFTSSGKRVWDLKYNGEVIKSSIDKQYLENLADEINSKEEMEE